jgi:DNA ligase-1
MPTLPTLYKLTSANALQYWQVSVEAATITTRYGHVGGAELSTSDTLTEGKNAGRSNATTPEQQATLEAQSRWDKQRKRGYVETQEAAQRGDVSEAIEGGVVPMTAKVWEEYAEKIVYPVAVQPKLDGHRMIAEVKVNVWAETAERPSGCEVSVDLWTRTRKRVTSVPHIAEALADLFQRHAVNGMLEQYGFTSSAAATFALLLDGELYTHDLRSDFERLSSLARQSKPHPDAKQLQYHVYDVVSPLGFRDRIAKLEHLFDASSPLRLVETVYADNAAQVFSHHEHFVKEGYEGAMVRHITTPYEHKRSSQLLKLKDFLDGDFVITTLEEGRGKLHGCVGAFVLKTEDGKEFRAKWAAPEADLRKAFAEPEKWIGQRAVVKYQNLSTDGIPRFPILLRRRDDL